MYGGVLERCVPACFNGLNYSKGAAIVPVTREDAPLLAKELDKSTYKVSVHFSTTITETICEKIKRIRRNEVQQMGEVALRLALSIPKIFRELDENPLARPFHPFCLWLAHR